MSMRLRSSRRTGSVVLGVLFAAGATFVAMRGPTSIQRTTHPPSTRAEATPFSVAFVPELDREGDAPYPEGAEGDDVAPVGPKAPVDMAGLRRRVAVRRPELAVFKDLTDKVLRSRADNERLRAMLASPRLVATAREDLLGKGERVFDESRQLQRVYSVDFLVMAAGWEGNPARGQALGAMRDVLLSTDFMEKGPEALKKSLAGDRLELVEALAVHDPRSLGDILAQVAGSPVEKLYAYAHTRAQAAIAKRAQALAATEPTRPAEPSPGE